MIDSRELIIGKEYKVIFDDCCIEGNFTSKLKEFTKYYDREDEQLEERPEDDQGLIFENGVYLDNYNGCIIEEVK